MRTKFKRWLAVTLAAAMTLMPSFSSFAAYEWEKATFSYDWTPNRRASSSDMQRIIIPGEGPGAGRGSEHDAAQDLPSDGFAGFEMPQPSMPDLPFDMPDTSQGSAIHDLPFLPGFAQGDEAVMIPEVPDEVFADAATLSDDSVYTEPQAYDEPVTWAEEADDDDGTVYAKLLVYDLGHMPPADEMLAGYIDDLFLGEEETFATALISDYWRMRFSGDELEFYDSLKEFIEDVAAGDEEYPVFNAEGIAPTLWLGKAALGLPESASREQWFDAALDYYLSNEINVNQVINYIYRDNPYDLYWADGSYVVSFAAHVDGDDCVIRLASVFFPAESGYEGRYADNIGNYPVFNVSNEDMANTRRSASKAREIVRAHEGESEAEMLSSFADEIRALTAYKDKVDVYYSSELDDPRQIIYVFDEDKETVVNSVGLSMAFQYLCDMAGLENCYTVTDTLSGRPHMHNVVVVDGVPYQVDLEEMP